MSTGTCKHTAGWLSPCFELPSGRSWRCGRGVRAAGHHPNLDAHSAACCATACRAGSAAGCDGARSWRSAVRPGQLHSGRAIGCALSHVVGARAGHKAGSPLLCWPLRSWDSAAACNQRSLSACALVTSLCLFARLCLCSPASCRLCPHCPPCSQPGPGGTAGAAHQRVGVRNWQHTVRL